MATKSDINEGLLNDVMSIYSQVENDMLEKVAKRIEKGITEKGGKEKIRYFRPCLPI